MCIRDRYQRRVRGHWMVRHIPSATMKLHCPLTHTSGHLQALSAAVTLKQLSCAHKHQLTLLRSGQHLPADAPLSEVPNLAVGDKMILFMRHQPTCCDDATHEPNPCSGRHVAVLRLVEDNMWEVRVVGAQHNSSLTSAVMTRLDKQIRQSLPDLSIEDRLSEEKHTADQELQAVHRAIEAAQQRLQAIEQQVSAKEQQMSATGGGDGQVEEAIAMLAAQVEQLEGELHSDSRSALLCSVCYAKPFVWVFPCGHAKCDDCGTRLVQEARGCPECRAPLADPRRLFWAGVG
eukprot:TRINITY_DN1943_c0_g2_i2.p1 TRINITY_DN1943_c0_g2~~TRINITY_DN1943_c0_g2_i2.p1  ORF type:complete len:290 (-),score=80.38 TRINITY_DN1943_c0_g2_i2:265-1134(-)